MGLHNNMGLLISKVTYKQHVKAVKASYSPLPSSIIISSMSVAIHDKHKSGGNRLVY